MRAPVFALGVVLIVIGGIAILMGPTTYQVPYTDRVTSDKSVTIRELSQTYTVQPWNYWYTSESVDVSGKDPDTVVITGSFTFHQPISEVFSGDYDFHFYVFDSANYTQWEQGHSYTPLRQCSRSYYSISMHGWGFTLPISRSDTYYFVFDNRAESVSRTFGIALTLTWSLTENVIKYRTEYDYIRVEAGVGIAVGGLAVAIIGATLKGKQAIQLPPAAPSTTPTAYATFPGCYPCFTRRLPQVRGSSTAKL